MHTLRRWLFQFTRSETVDERLVRLRWRVSVMDREIEIYEAMLRVSIHAPLQARPLSTPKTRHLAPGLSCGECQRVWPPAAVRRMMAPCEAEKFYSICCVGFGKSASE
jgi:hypothetical protein